MSGKAVLVLCPLLVPGLASAQQSRTVRGEGAEGELFLPARTPAPLVFVLHTAWGHVSPNGAQYSKNNGTYVVYNSKCDADACARAVAWFRTYLK